MPPIDLNDRGFLTRAKEQLDADHFGLDKIKRRLIEYLAVVRLKQVNAARDAEVEAAALAAQPDNKAAKNEEPLPSGQAKIDVPQVPKGGKRSVKGPILL